MGGHGHAVEEMRPRRNAKIPWLIRRRDRGGQGRRQVLPRAHADDRGGRAPPAYTSFRKDPRTSDHAGKVNFPSEDDELAARAAAAVDDAAPAARAAAPGAPAVVVFRDASLGITISHDAAAAAIVLRAADAASPACGVVAPGARLARVDGVAVGAVATGDAFRAAHARIAAARRPLVLEFVQ